MTLSALAQRQLFSLFPPWGTVTAEAYRVTVREQWNVSSHGQLPWWVLRASGHPDVWSGYVRAGSRVLTAAEYEREQGTPRGVLDHYRAAPAFAALFEETRGVRDVQVKAPANLSKQASDAVRRWYGVTDPAARLILELDSADLSKRQFRLWRVRNVGLSERRQRAEPLALDWAAACAALLNNPDSTVAAARLPHTGRNDTLERRTFQANPLAFGAPLSRMLAARMSFDPEAPGELLDTWFTREILAAAGLTASNQDAPRWLLFQLRS